MNNNEDNVITRPHPLRVYRAIKSATQITVDGMHGVVSCAANTRGGKSMFSNFTSINEPDKFIAADQIADLEHFIGEPYITRELARIQNCALVELPEANLSKSWMLKFSSSAKNNGQALDSLAKAISDDGEVSSQEIKTLNLRNICQDVIQDMVNMLAHMDLIEEQADKDIRRR